MPNTQERINTLVGAPDGLQARLTSLYDIWEKSNTTVSEKEKTLQKMVDLAINDPDLGDADIKRFQGMLAKAKTGKTANLTDLIEAVRKTGTDPLVTFRKGIMKGIGDDGYQYTPAGIKSKAAIKKAADDKKAEKAAKDRANATNTAGPGAASAK